MVDSVKNKSKVCFAIALMSGTLVMTQAHAATSPSPLSQILRQDLKNRKVGSFSGTLASWETHYGARAFSPLLELASDTRLADPDRYVALMGAAKIGGTAAAPKFLPLLKDSSWMIRSGALRALSALHHAETSVAVLPLLHDSALVVRMEAIEAIDRLDPPGSHTALLSAIRDSSNYHGGRAQWVPQRALKSLVRRKELSRDEGVSLAHMCPDSDFRKQILASVR